MDEFTLNVTKHENGCRIDLVYDYEEFNHDAGKPTPQQNRILYSADGKVVGFRLDFNGEGAPTIVWNKAEQAPTEDDIEF